MTGLLPAKVHALHYATENLFEMQNMIPTAQGPKVAESPLDLDVRDIRMQSILLSLMDTFDAGNGTAAAIPKSAVCHADLSSWQSFKRDGDGFGSQDLTSVDAASPQLAVGHVDLSSWQSRKRDGNGFGCQDLTSVDAPIPQLAVGHVDLSSWQCQADLSSWQSRKCDGNGFGSQDLAGVAGLESLEHSFDHATPALWHRHKYECLKSANSTQKKEVSNPYIYSKGPLAPTADTLPTVATTRTLDAIPTQDLLSLSSLQE